MANAKDAQHNNAVKYLSSISSIIIVLLLCLQPKISYSDAFSGPTALAMGGAGRAAKGPMECQFLNPASCVHEKGVYAGFAYQFHERDSHITDKDWSVLVLDAHDGVLVPAGASYVSREKKTGLGLIEEQEIQVSLGFLALETLSVGVSAKRLVVKQPAVAEKTAWNGNIGALFVPVEWMGLGAVAYNVLDDHEGSLRPSVAVGSHFIVGSILRIRGDGEWVTKANPENKGIFYFGLESLFELGFKLRGGARWDELDKRRYATVGVGWEAPRFNVDYAFEKETQSQGEIRQSVDLIMTF